MSEGSGAPRAAEPEVVRRRGPSIVWVIPIVALLIGLGIWYRTTANQGPEVTILFDEGGGIEAGKTKVKYRGLEVGEVLGLEIQDVDTVAVKARLGPGAWPFMTDETKFWIEKPRVGAGGISGLDTLVSGSYIALMPAIDPEGNPVGEPTQTFDGLEKRPLEAVYPNGLRIGLEADDLRGLREGSEIRFRDIGVGEIERYEIKPDGQGVRLWALIAEEYRDLVRPSTEFWNSTGVELDVRPSGVKLQAESLASMLGGAIDFATPPEAYIERPVGDGAIFQLHESRTVAQKALEQGVGLVVWVEARKVGSVRAGDDVYYRDVRIGGVGEPRLSEDARTVRFPLQIDERYKPLVRENSRFWNRSGFQFEADLRGISARSGTVATILEGGIGLATPTVPGEEAQPGEVFVLHEGPEETWQAWSPKITLRELDPEEEPLPHVVPIFPPAYTGLQVVLSAPRLGSLGPGSPVYYRDIVVGEIGESRLAADARTIEADAWIEPRYATLVRTNTRFWNASGIDVDAGITKGVKIRTQSLEAMMTGGVAFATPDQPGAPVGDGAQFTLHPEPDDDWLEWSPSLPYASR